MALCALEINFPDTEVSDSEKVTQNLNNFKILFFVEKVSQSEGQEKLILSTGHTKLPQGEINILLPFKNAFPEHFSIPEIKKENFFDVFTMD